MQPITLRQVERLAGLPPSSESCIFQRVASFSAATPDAIVFAESVDSLQKAVASDAGLILAPARLPAVAPADRRILRVQHPRYVFALCGQWLDRFAMPVVHPTASIDPEARLGMGTAVGAGCVIEAGAVIGEGCSLGPNVTVHGCVTLGDRVLVQAGAVLGGLGFGYVRGPKPAAAEGAEQGSGASRTAYVRFPQQGILVIEDDVEIGANTTIDRGALGETRIGAGTKIDNLVQIGHNCRIGRNVILAAQVGISGSCVLGDDVILAGQVGLGDHVTLGPGITLGGQGGVYPGKTVVGEGEVFAGTPAEPVRDHLRSLARLRRLK